MNLAQKFENSWELAKTSLRVIRDNPRLALFPVISTVCSVLLACFFFAPIIALVMGQVAVTAWFESHGWHGGENFREAFGWIFYAYGAVIYLVSLFVATFFNVAFYNEILRALSGAPVSLGGGLRFATGRLGPILMWSLLAGTVGLVIRAIEERLGWLGKIVMGFIGTAWSVAAVFAIPVIVRREENNPFMVLKASALTLRQTWGESLVGFVGIQLAGLAVAIGFVALVAMGVIGWGFFHLGWLGIALVVVAILGAIAAGVLQSMATHVYRCALYVFASEGTVPQPYTREMMDAAWKIKKS